MTPGTEGQGLLELPEGAKPAGEPDGEPDNELERRSVDGTFRVNLS